MNSKRLYREDSESGRFKFFSAKVKETDLWIGVSSKSYAQRLQVDVENYILQARWLLESYIDKNSLFRTTLSPILIEQDAPDLVKNMVWAGNMAGVGPMAAVAGTFAEEIGRYLLMFSPEVIVENGGDIFLKIKDSVTVGIYAGESGLNEKLALRIFPEQTPLGVCSSSGTIGPSLSHGKTDVAVVLSKSTALADAVATAVGNMVNCASDLESALSYARKIDGICGVLLIYEEHIAAWGDLTLVTS